MYSFKNLVYKTEEVKNIVVLSVRVPSVYVFMALQIVCTKCMDMFLICYDANFMFH